jgi:hypothetical protein
MSRDACLLSTTGKKYGYTPEHAEAAPGKMVEVLRGLSARVEQQHAKGSRFFIGDSLTTLGIHWRPFATALVLRPWSGALIFRLLGARGF